MGNDAHLGAHHAPRRLWPQAIGFGLPLALLELGTLIVFYRYFEILRPLRAITLGLLLYVIVAAAAGYWFRQHGGQHGVWAGVRAGLAGAMIFLLMMTVVFAVMWVRYVTTPRFPHEFGLYDPTGQLMIFAQALGLLAAISGVGVVLSALGGWLGGVIAGWWDEPREQPGEQRA